MADNESDLIDIDNNNPAPGEFEIKCLKCGSTEVKIDDSRAMGSSWTGPYGSCDLVCTKCGNIKVLIDT